MQGGGGDGGAVDGGRTCADDAGTDGVPGEGVEGGSSGEAGDGGIVVKPVMAARVREI